MRLRAGRPRGDAEHTAYLRNVLDQRDAQLDVAKVVEVCQPRDDRSERQPWEKERSSAAAGGELFSRDATDREAQRWAAAEPSRAAFSHGAPTEANEDKCPSARKQHAADSAHSLVASLQTGGAGQRGFTVALCTNRAGARNGKRAPPAAPRYPSPRPLQPSAPRR